MCLSGLPKLFYEIVCIFFLNSQQCEVIGAVRKVNDDDNLEENRKKVWNYSDDFAKRPFISFAIIISVVVNTYRQNNH